MRTARARVRRIPIGRILLLAGVLFHCAGTGSERLRVVAVRDGDTIELEDGRLVRYIGIDAPERGEPLADDALDYNSNLVRGRRVRLEYGSDRVDRYGRTLAIVHVGDTNVSEALVRAGMARVSLYRGNLRYGARLIRAQRRARRARIGVWTDPIVETAPRYIGSESSFRFHHPDCPHAAEIAGHNLIEFPSRGKAFDHGFSPCRQCCR